MASKLKVKMVKGKISYEIKAKRDDMLILEDPHTGESFKLPAALATLETCGYQITRGKKT